MKKLGKLATGLAIVVAAISGYVNAQARGDYYETIVEYYNEYGSVVGESWTDCRGITRTSGTVTNNYSVERIYCDNKELPLP